LLWSIATFVFSTEDSVYTNFCGINYSLTYIDRYPLLVTSQYLLKITLLLTLCFARRAQNFMASICARSTGKTSPQRVSGANAYMALFLVVALRKYLSSKTFP
jgi:hypothetical protein